MKTIVLGRGFLGKEFERQGFEVWGKDKFYFDYSSTYFNDFGLKSYDVIINCIGKSNTRWCEDRKNRIDMIWSNSLIPEFLSAYCKKENKKLVHISTGCLYDEYIPQPCKETDFIVAHCNYTLSKWTGELHSDPDRDLILRPRLYFSDVEDRNNLLCKLPKFKYFITDVNSFSRTKTIVEATKALLDANQVGIFNVANEGTMSLWQMAKLIGLTNNYDSQITGKELIQQEKLYLVNNTLDLSKLKKFYKPQNITDAVLECWHKLIQK